MTRTAKPPIRNRYRGTIRFGAVLLTVAGLVQAVWLIILAGGGL